MLDKFGVASPECQIRAAAALTQAGAIYAKGNFEEKSLADKAKRAAQAQAYSHTSSRAVTALTQYATIFTKL